MMRAPSVRARQRGFLDFSFPELVITFSIALVVLGPKKLPGLVQQVGRWVGRARHMARQFREQLEQEVNSINEVKPVTRPVAPEVGPPAPGTEATGVVDSGTAEAGAATHAHSDADSGTGTDSEAGSSAGSGATSDTGSSAEAGSPVEPPPGSDVHPETQIYFALNGTEPAVVAQNPYAPAPAADPQTSPQASPEQSSAAAGAPSAPGAAVAEGHAPGAPPAAPAAPAAESGQPATVPVVFPHDHG